ncbi:hypothetical protein PtB15_3B613 [Puccinia triticina]|nr:hypothetical protein PtB15_3B613 [Puccinia triticina]
MMQTGPADFFLLSHSCQAVIFSTTEPKDGQSGLGDQAELKAIHLSHRPGLDPNLSPPIKLYTIDAEVPAAMASYKRVQEAYWRIFQTMGIPFTVAKADIEAIGTGEDRLIHCTLCLNTSKLELAPSSLSPRGDNPSRLQVQFFSSPGTGWFPAAVLPATHELHPLKLLKVCPDICPVQSFENNVLPAFKLQWEQIEVLVDESCLAVEIEQIFERVNSQFRRCFSPPVQDSDGRLELSPLSIWPSLPTYTVHNLRTVSVGKPGSGP